MKRPSFSRYVEVLPGGEFEKSLGAETVIPVPMCFDAPEQAAEWAALAKRAKVPPVCGYCTDCTPEFKQAMTDCGRCENIGVQFVKRKGELMGVLRG